MSFCINAEPNLPRRLEHNYNNSDILRNDGRKFNFLFEMTVDVGKCEVVRGDQVLLEAIIAGTVNAI